MTLKALVLGGGGFIGGHLVNSLVSDNYWVRAVDLKHPDFRSSSAHEFVVGDLRNAEVVDSVFKVDGDFDEVYQLAADMGGATYINCGDHDGDVMSNSVIINANVAKACIKYNVKKLFFSSSACVYHQSTKDISLCIEDQAYPAFPDNEYGWEKLFSERMYTNFRKQYNLNVRIARFHSIVGDFSTWKGGKEKAHSALARKVAEIPDGGTIEIIGDGLQKRTFLYVGDCVKGIRTLMASEIFEPVNIGSDHVVTINEYVELLRKISGKQFFIKYVPGPTGVKERFCDLTKVKQLTTWQPTTTLEEATKITYDWINEQLKVNVLFVYQTIGVDNAHSAQCGIGIRGKLTADILTESAKYHFIPCLADSYAVVEQYTLRYAPKIIIYNYHSITTPWMNDATFRNKYSDIHHLMIHYDITQAKINSYNLPEYHNFKYVITDDNTLTPTENFFIVSRSMPKASIDNSSLSNDITSIPIIGFQGFGFPHKGLTRLAHQVNSEFDKAIIRLHIPFSYFGDRDGHIARNQIAQMRQIITKPEITMEISHDFLSDQEIIAWLNSNTVNCYFYDYLDGAGIASSPDYALAARKPIAVTRSHQMRHFWNLEPSILIEQNSLKTIINNGVTPLLPLYEKYTHLNVIRDYEALCNRLLNL